MGVLLTFAENGVDHSSASLAILDHLRCKDEVTAEGDTLIDEMNFLVVEDHDFQRDSLVVMLQRLNPKGIYSAKDGERYKPTNGGTAMMRDASGIVS